jgi:SAM-dependent methyltransferase
MGNQKKGVKWDPQNFREHYEKLYKESRMLQEQEKRRLDFYLNTLQLKNSDILLDAGCGYGRLSKILLNNVKKIIGIDINEDNIQYAKEYVGTGKFEGHVVDLSKGILPFSNESIDKVVIDNVLMFLNNEEQENLFKEIKRVLKSGGVLAFNTSNANYLFKPLWDFFNSLYSLKSKLKKRVTPIHYSYSLAFYERILSDRGFINVTSIGDTYYRKMGVGQLEVFPRFLHSYLARKDQAHYNTSQNRKMSSLTIAATKQ